MYYNLNFTYHEGKAKVVTYTLRWKMSHSLIMIVLLDHLCLKLREMEIELTPTNGFEVRMSALGITLSIFHEIQTSQLDNIKLERSKHGLAKGRSKYF